MARNVIRSLRQDAEIAKDYRAMSSAYEKEVDEELHMEMEKSIEREEHHNMRRLYNDKH